MEARKSVCKWVVGMLSFRGCAFWVGLDGKGRDGGVSKALRALRVFKGVVGSDTAAIALWRNCH